MAPWQQATKLACLVAVPVVFTYHPLTSGNAVGLRARSAQAIEDGGGLIASWSPLFREAKLLPWREQVSFLTENVSLTMDISLALASGFSWALLRSYAGVGVPASPAQAAFSCAARATAATAVIVAADLAGWAYRATTYGPNGQVRLLRCDRLAPGGADGQEVLAMKQGNGLQFNPLVKGHRGLHEGPCHYTCLTMARESSKEEVMLRRVSQWAIPTAVVLACLLGSAPLAPFCLLPIAMWKGFFGHMAVQRLNRGARENLEWDYLSACKQVGALDGPEAAWTFHRRFSAHEVNEAQKLGFVNKLKQPLRSFAGSSGGEVASGV